MPIFWVISTAFVLQGVTIAALGPIKVPVRESLGKVLSGCLVANNQCSLESVSAESCFVVCTAYTVIVEVGKY